MESTEPDDCAKSLAQQSSEHCKERAADRVEQDVERRTLRAEIKRLAKKITDQRNESTQRYDELVSSIDRTFKILRNIGSKHD